MYHLGGPLLRAMTIECVSHTLLKNRPERAIPILSRRMLLIISNAGQMQVVHLLAGARQAAALRDQLTRHLPMLLADGLEDMIVEHGEGAKLGRSLRHRIAQDGIQ